MSGEETRNGALAELHLDCSAYPMWWTPLLWRHLQDVHVAVSCKSMVEGPTNMLWVSITLLWT